MQISHHRRLFLIWLLLSLLLTIFLFAATQARLEYVVHERVKDHLLLTLDESHFGNAKNRANDQKALQRVGQQIDAALRSLVVSRWYSPQKECVVRLQRIDDVAIEDEPMERAIAFKLQRNQVEREVVVGVSCSPDWKVAAGAAGFLGLLFVAIHLFVPPPLSKTHRQWINYLLERGYTGKEAFDIVRRYDTTRLTLSPPSWPVWSNCTTVRGVTFPTHWTW